MSREHIKVFQSSSRCSRVGSTLRSNTRLKCSVLILDDDYEYALILSRFLASPKVDIGIESEWWSVVSQGHVSRYNLIICDLHMPQYNGKDVLESVAQYVKQIQLLFITALSDQEVRVFLPEPVREQYPVISKSKGMAYVSNQIQFLIQTWFENQKLAGRRG